MEIITVTQLNTYIKAGFDESSVLRNVLLVGEISNFIHYNRSGHFYFTIKDETSQLKCVMFFSYNSALKFVPENGMKVLCRGNVSVYERDGVYQLYVKDMQPEGAGALSIAFEQMKSKLEKEGLFDESHKKPLPRFPKRIGVVTSDMGAAVQDITKVLARRFPAAEMVLYPSAVQGAGAENGIASGIEKLNELGDIDVIIVGRGGGSAEDLWSFNTEIAARAVFKSKVPVISAVGHETDFTICDFVADLRAPTPSAAAELAVPDMYAQLVFIASLEDKIKACVIAKLEAQQYLVDSFSIENFMVRKLALTENAIENLSALKQRICSNIAQKLRLCELSLMSTMKSIAAYNPISVLSRGYTIAMDERGDVIHRAGSVKIYEKIKIKFSDGVIDCTVNNKRGAK